MKPTIEQLADPKWWDANTPKGTTHIVHGSCPLKVSGQVVEYFSGDDGGSWKPNGCELANYVEGQLVSRPSPAWSGEGLPPIGCKIENKSDYKGWSVVILHRHGAALVEQEDGVAADYVLIGKSMCFPIRTPEQIAADEREAAVKEACYAVEVKIEAHNKNIDCSAAIRATIEAMIDAGYSNRRGA